MLKVGLTGGIGSGKSTACQYFAELGLPVLDADSIAHELTQKGQPALTAIARQFGAEVIDRYGELDRNLVRQRIFSDAKLRLQLEAILHPLIKQEIVRRVKNINAPCVIIAVPLLIESLWTDIVDRILVIDSPVELQIKRSITRDKNTEAQIRAVIQSQASREERLSAADDVINNDSDLAHLHDQIEKYYAIYSTPS